MNDHHSHSKIMEPLVCFRPAKVYCPSEFRQYSILNIATEMIVPNHERYLTV